MCTQFILYKKINLCKPHSALKWKQRLKTTPKNKIKTFCNSFRFVSLCAAFFFIYFSFQFSRRVERNSIQQSKWQRRSTRELMKSLRSNNAKHTKSHTQGNSWKMSFMYNIPFIHRFIKSVNRLNWKPYVLLFFCIHSVLSVLFSTHLNCAWLSKAANSL